MQRAWLDGRASGSVVNDGQHERLRCFVRISSHYRRAPAAAGLVSDEGTYLTQLHHRSKVKVTGPDFGFFTVAR